MTTNADAMTPEGEKRVEELGREYGRLQKARHKAWHKLLQAVFPKANERGITIVIRNVHTNEITCTLVPQSSSGSPDLAVSLFEDDKHNLLDQSELRAWAKDLCPAEMEEYEAIIDELTPIRKELERYACGELK